MPSGRALGVISRAPVPGNVKTRLAIEIGEDAAAALYAAFLRDVLVSAASLPDSTVTVFHPASDDMEALAGILPPGTLIHPETGQGYSEIIPAALRQMLETSPVAALLGADSPGLPYSTLHAAFNAVESGVANIAICPAADGGYCLLATNGDYPQVFQDIEWSTERVFSQIMANADRDGLRVTVLPEWYDVDELADLQRLANDLSADVGLSAGASRLALRQLRESGVQIPLGVPPWRLEERQAIYETPWRSLVSDRVTTHLGEEIDYAYLETGRAVWVVPVTDDGRIVLVRQYRHPIGEIILEVPAGGGDDDPVSVAERELREETGGVARELFEIASYFPASAHLTHTGHVVLALGVEPGTPELEPTELIRTQIVPLDIAVDMARRGEIADSQSALAILAAEPLIRTALRRR